MTVARAMRELRSGQVLHDKTRAVHGAGFFPSHRLMATREDVGRHNALDKLIGAKPDY
jgi:FdhD protein